MSGSEEICLDTKSNINKLITGEDVDKETQASILIHLANCESCRKYLRKKATGRETFM